MTATLTDPGSGNSVNAVAFNPAGTTLATGGDSRSTYLWNPAMQEKVTRPSPTPEAETP